MEKTRCLGIGLLCAAAIAAQAVAPARGAARRPAAVSTKVQALAGQVLSELNVVRSQHHLSLLRSSPGLRAAAVEHSRDMASTGYFSHSSADGTPFWKRLQRLYPSTGFRSWNVGETLVWSSPDLDAQGAVADWLASPPHRAIVLGSQWREVGVASVHSSDAPGVYGGLAVTIVTADFGSRTR